MSWSVIVLSLITRTVGHTLSSKRLSSFALAARRTTGMSEAPLRAAWTMARASGSSASFRHAVSNWELSTPGIGASFSPLSMQVANTSSSSRTYSCKSPGSMVSLPYRQSPQTCPTVQTKQNDFVFFLPQMWFWTVSSDDEEAQVVEFVPVRWSSRHDQEESQGSKTQARSCARKQTHG